MKKSSPPFIWFDGSVFGGRGSTLQSLFISGSPPIDFYHDHDGTWKWQLNFQFPGGSRVVNLAYARHRSTLPYDTPDLDFEDDWQHEIEHIKHIDGIIFVANSDPHAQVSNGHFINRLQKNLAWVGRKLEDVPVIFQLNHRDLDGKMPIETMKKTLYSKICDYQLSIAIRQQGTHQALKKMIDLLDTNSPQFSPR